VNLTTTQAIKALNILSKKLDAIAKEESAAGLVKSAALATQEKEFVDGFIGNASEILRMDEDQMPGRNRTVLQTALRHYCKHARAAAGTVSALGRDDWADELKQEADRLEQTVLPALDEQKSLPMGATAES